MANFEHWPTTVPVFSVDDIRRLSNQSSTLENPEVDVDTIITKSDSFPVNFPIETVRCKYLKEKGIPDTVLKKNINSVYPILHETALRLFLDFLNHKKQFGSAIEKSFYQDFTVERLVDRFLKKRAVVFCGRHDTFMLLDGKVNSEHWEIIGTKDETAPRILEKCLSYDEIKLSALVSVSSYTHFINDGSRHNCGKYSDVDVEQSGIIIGLIGPRFARPDFMEYQDIVVSKEQNVKEKGYGKSRVPTTKGLFLNFYGEESVTYKKVKSELKNKEKYHDLTNKRYFNNNVYAKRIAISFDTVLLEANERARECGKMAYLYVVGIGLGVWRISNHQFPLFMDVFAKRIGFLADTLRNISDICFAYIDAKSCGDCGNGDTMPIPEHPNGGIKIHITQGNPHAKLTGQDEGKLLVVSYAWDGNSLPGNEFWGGSLSNSSDSATASSTQVAELHNAHINPRVSAESLKIATLRGVVSFSEYVRQLQLDR